MKDIIIARKEEKRMLHNLRNEKTAQFLAVYGRRRVGKTSPMLIASATR